MTFVTSNATLLIILFLVLRLMGWLLADQVTRCRGQRKIAFACQYYGVYAALWTWCRRCCLR